MGSFSFDITTPENGNYHFRIKKVGQEFCRPKKRAENEAKDYYSLHFILYGSGKLKAYGNEYLLNEGTAFLNYANEERWYQPEQRNPWAYIWIELYGDNLDEFFKEVGFTKEKPFTKIRYMNELRTTLNNLYHAYNKEAFSEVTCYAYFMLVIDYLLKNNRDYASRDLSDVLRMKQVIEILTYINCNYSLDLNVVELADIFYVTPRTLLRMFDESIGMSPLEYINSFRISIACKMLAQNESCSVKDVARECGFADPLYFSKIFKKKKGITPTQYIKNHEDDPFDWLREKNILFR